MRMEHAVAPPDESARNAALIEGFTLIELSIVLVIIGLIVGGVLVGRDLISAAAIRATISQIEKYNTAANTFRGKYGYLPGDIPGTPATQFGFAVRGTIAGQGDGNGILEAANGASSFGTYQSKGETAMFWADLSQAGLIEGSYTAAAAASDQALTGGANLSATSTPTLDAFFPAAKLSGNWILVYSVGGVNYYVIAGSPSIQPNGPASSVAGMTVQQAYNIDKKVDDGVPQLGRVTTQAIFQNTIMNWASGSFFGAAPGVAASASATSCYDNGGSAAVVDTYSVSQNGGAGRNCALSLQFQ